MGCDFLITKGNTNLYCFNPRTRTGCDLADDEDLAASHRFNHTHPHGVRHLPCGYDLNLLDVSIHAPARGATGYCPLLSVNYFVSIHAPARGATLGMPPLLSGCRVSIHAPARGATIHGTYSIPHRVCFNPRTRTGCD